MSHENHARRLDTRRTMLFKTHWAFDDPGPNEHARATVSPRGLDLAAKGVIAGRSSPLMALDGPLDCRTEVSVTVHDANAEAGLLLFADKHTFCGFGMTRSRLLGYTMGRRTYWQEPMRATRHMRFRLERHQHVVTAWHQTDHGEWVRAAGYATFGRNAMSVEDLQRLRPAIYATGQGYASFSDFTFDAYSPSTTAESNSHRPPQEHRRISA